MAESVVNFAVEKIGNMIIEEAKFLRGVEDQVEQLKSDLDRMRSFLRNAEARQHEPGDLKVWISQTKDLAYEVEDLLESYAFKIASQKENIFKRCILKECYLRHSMGSEIQKLQSKISGLTKSFQDYGIIPIVERGNPASSLDQQLRRTSSAIVEDDFIPLDNDVEKLVGQLVNEQCAVVSIYGMGGLGKTTLAKRVYSHPKLQGCFEYFAWVSVSKQWQKREILQGILIKFFPEQRDEITKWREEELVRELSQTMQKKKCLVVLDDIWSTEVWECVKDAFPIKDKSSKLKLLLTTRIRGVASHIAPNGFHHEPRLLNEFESWELLRLKALRGRTNIDPEENSKLEELGKEMVKRCGGLPLAVDVLAGLLANKREWDDVHRTIKARIGRSKVEEILALSYNDLRPELKPFFLYLGRFPEGSKIEVERLYQLWLAEGMISVKDKRGEESMIDVAEHYLEELAERSMVQIKVDEDMVGKTRIKYCRLHDLMREVSLEKAKEENFLLYVHSRNGFSDEMYESSSLSHEIHRLVIHVQKKDDGPAYVLPQERMTRHLRSLRLSIEGNLLETLMKSQFRWFGMLRVLEVEGLTGVELVNFEVVGNLIHLRYFSVRSNGLLPDQKLPSSLGNLKHLLTINLQFLGNIRIPNIFWKMTQLKHIYLPHGIHKTDGGDKLRFDGLNKLEILDGFDSRFSSYKDLVKLPSLRYVYIKHFVEYHDNIDELFTFISSSTRLYKVRLFLDLSETWDETVLSEVVSKLFECRKISQLVISGVICNFPKFETCNLALDLVSLTLALEVINDPMETLERFPNLRYLVLFGCFRGEKMLCRASGFPRLRTLVIEDLWRLTEWSIAEGSMPNLSSLTIGNCPNLKIVPDGLSFIKALKKLKIRGMPLEFVKRLQGEDLNKIQHVPLVTITQ